MPPIANQIETEQELEEVLSRPDVRDIDALRNLQGDILILGVGGKMGPSLARRAARALQASGARNRVIAVSRFSNRALVDQLESAGVKTLSRDLLDASQLRQLPDAENVIYMAARKFGTAGEECMTWATNAYLPGLVADRFRNSRITTWSTGNVYALSAVGTAGPNESVPPAPVGEYAQSALARERVFEYFSRQHGTPVAVLRLNYAVELRYGVLVDIARKVHGRAPVDVSMGYVNVIWQGDANSVCLRTLPLCSSPPFVLNVTSPATYSVRWLAEQFAHRMGRVPVEFTGVESDVALLSDARKCSELFGPPDVSVEQMMDWITAWILAGSPLWNKPTHFEVKDGKF